MKIRLLKEINNLGTWHDRGAVISVESARALLMVEAGVAEFTDPVAKAAHDFVGAGPPRRDRYTGFMREVEKRS